MRTSYLDELKHVIPFDYRALSSGFLVVVGVVLGIVASFICCLGINLQKVSLCLLENENVSPWKQPKWVAGFVCVVAGTVLDFMAFGLAPQSLLAPLAALSLVWNLGMASHFHNERYTKIDLIAVGLIFCGTGITVVFASHEAKEYTLGQLKDLYREPRMYFYSVIAPLVLIAHYYMIHYADAMDARKRETKFSKLMGVLGYAGFAGVFGGQSVLFAKSSIELLKDAAHGDLVFLHIETYMIVALMTGCLITQITFLNGGLKRFDSLYVMPVYQSYWILSGVIGGLVYFGEWDYFTSAQITWFLFGSLVTLVGLFVLTQKEHHSISMTARESYAMSQHFSSNSFMEEEEEVDDDEEAPMIRTQPRRANNGIRLSERTASSRDP